MLIVLIPWQGRSYAENTQQQAKDNKLKAAYLLNLARFTYWPEAALSKSENLTICVYNSEITILALQSIENRKANKKNISIKLITGIEELSGCQMVYVLDDKVPGSAELKTEAIKHNCVTVSESTGFVERGGMIELVKYGISKRHLLLLLPRRFQAAA